MSGTPRVSVGLPVYNGERYVALAIDSILGQTFRDFELIISDNASTDSTEEICRGYAARDSRIRYVRQPTNVGATKNFNGVVDFATAPYFKWASDDDLIAPDCLARFVDVLDRDPTVVLAHSKTRFIDSNGAHLPSEDSGLHIMDERPSERLEHVWRKLQYCNAQFGVMRVEALRQTPLFGSFIGSDLCFLAELSLHGKFYEVPEYLLFRRFHTMAASNLTPEQLMGHYGLQQGELVLYYWRHLGEHTKLILRAPLEASERLKVLALLAQKTVWQRHELTEEIGFLFRYLLGRPYPILGAGRRSSGPGPSA